MGESDSFERLKNLDPNHVEINRLGETLKEEEFRQLFVDYVKEIQDSDHKESYEDEITQLEEEQGNEITFLHPTPCYVIKASINGNEKCFINIFGNDSIDKPSSTPSEKDGARSLQWSLPHLMSPPSEDFNNKGERYQVFDVLFHPDTLYLAQKNKTFRNIVNNTACISIENQFDVELDKYILKFPEIKYKASIIRKPSAEGPIERSPNEKEFFDEIYAHADESKQVFKNVKKNDKICKRDNTDYNSTYTTPKYVIKHRVLVEFEEYSEHKESKLLSAIPKEVILEVNLPLLKSANEMILDVTENMIQLISEKPAKYKLVLSLPYQVNQIDVEAEFNEYSKKLVITLPVRRNRTPVPLLDLNKEDTGVDSDNGSLISLGSEEEASENSISNITGTEGKPEVTCEPQFWSEFLDENIHYSIPDFSSYVFNNTINFTFNVENVDSESVSILINHDRKTVHIKFIKYGVSFHQIYYSFLVKLPVNSIEDSKVSVEIWEDNVIFQIPYKNCDIELVSFMYGLCEEDLREKFLEEPHIINAAHENSNALNPTDEELKNDGVEEATKESKSFDYKNTDDKHNLRSQYSTEDEESQDLNDYDLLRSINVQTSCESSGASTFCPSRRKGILKKSSFVWNNISGSISESGVDHCIGPLDYEGRISIPEHNGASSELSTKKKRVRFNDVVIKQLYSPDFLKERRHDLVDAAHCTLTHKRSISESSVDNCIGSLDYEGEISIPEDSERAMASPEDKETRSELSTSLKKTVRFNYVVSKKFYRFDSSIVSQMKKNQRKAQKKKKDQERRHSEIEEKKEDQPLLNRESAEDEKTGMQNLTIEEENIFSFEM